MTAKASLRQQLRATLRSLPPGALAQASIQLVAQITAWPVFKQAAVVALFYPTATEPDLLPLLQIPDKIFLFPLCHPDRSLSWHLPTGLEHWKTSRFGITEPDPVLSPPRPAGNLPLVLVPGLAFTCGGDRIGHGAGFYDRFLATLPQSTVTAGVCFTPQILTHIPAETHDIRVHRVFYA